MCTYQDLLVLILPSTGLYSGVQSHPDKLIISLCRPTVKFYQTFFNRLTSLSYNYENNTTFPSFKILINRLFSLSSAKSGTFLCSHRGRLTRRICDIINSLEASLGPVCNLNKWDMETWSLWETSCVQQLNWWTTFVYS